MPSALKINDRILHQFLKHCTAQGLSDGRILSLRNNLNWYIKHTRKPFNKLNQGDIEDLMCQLEKAGYSEWTKYTRKAVLLRFMRWLKKKKHPKEVEGVKLHQPKDTLIKSDLIAFEELNKIVKAAAGAHQWQALFMTTYDGNFRSGEVLSATLQDLTIHQRYMDLSYRRSKTWVGTKTLTISTPYLTEWLEHHPHRDNPKAPLFMTYDKRYHRWVPITGNTYRAALKRHAHKAGVKRKVWPHLLRHSRTTQLLDSKVPLRIVEKSGGWKPGSRAFRRYDHLSNRDYKDEMLVQGGVRKDTVEGKRVQVRECLVCGVVNPPGREKCKTCKQPLDLEESGEKERKALEKMREIEERVKRLEGGD